jgi:type VI secretion system secreted protein VgrG
VHLASGLDLLRQDVDSRIYQDMDVTSIVGQLLTEQGLDGAHQSWRLVGTYPKREVCVRYGETAFDFVSRLLEEEGIHVRTESGDSGEIVIFEDDSTTAPPIDGTSTLTFRGPAGLSSSDDAVGFVTHTRRTASGKVTLRDYDFKNPKADLTADASADVDTDLDAYDYPGLYADLSVGKRLAKVRLDALQAERATYTAETTCARLLPGRSFDLADAPDDLDGSYVITGVVHEMRDGLYRAHASFVPKKVVYRLPQRTPRPILHGPETAVVVAPAGAPVEDIHTDAFGRCKVRFHWDRYAKGDDTSSCWIRTSQMQTSGSMILPRVGWEVIVEFLEGNPDRPIVSGRVYNGRFMPPYALPEGKSRSALQTQSSPGGAGRNGIRTEDKGGSEEMHVESQKDTTLATANDKTVSTGVDASKAVTVDSTTTVGGNQTVKVTSGYENTVKGAQAVTVGGSRAVEVNAVYAFSSGGASATSVGGSHFEMDGDPVAALLKLAVKAATEAAAAEANQALQQLDQAVQSKVDQVMGPIHALQQQAAAVQSGMDAVSQGNLGAAKDAFGAAAGMPGPQQMTQDMTGGGAQGAPGGGGGGGDPLMAMAKGAIDQAAGAVEDAAGAGGADGGGSSEANAAGPDGAVGGNAAANSSTGPGYSMNVCSATHAESVGALKVTLAAAGIHTTAKGARSQKIGALRVELVGGTRAETCLADKTEKAAGLLVVSGSPESETVGGSRSTMVGGAILEKIGASGSVTAGGKAVLLGAFHKVDAKTSIVFKCKGSEVVIDGGGITIKAALVTISAPKIAQTKAVTEA